MPFGVNSEVGRLRQVMVHRPGLEHTRPTPSNAEELLFDDVLWVARAKAEHDMFCEAMRDRGVEVFEAEELLAQALGSPEARASRVKLLTPYQVNSALLKASGTRPSSSCTACPPSTTLTPSSAARSWSTPA